MWLGLGIVVQILADAVVGVRLLNLSRRTHELPEFCFGACALLIGAVGLPLSILARILLANEHALAEGLLGAALEMQNLACVALFCGTWRVFRPVSHWTGFAVVVASAALFAAVPGQAWTTGFAAETGGGAWFWLGFGLRGSAFAWATAESANYWMLLRRRQRIGLADPVLVDRFRLWSLSCGSVVCGFAVFIAAHLTGTSPGGSAPVLLAGSIIGIIAGVSIGLAFAPPARYLRYVAQRA